MAVVVLGCAKRPAAAPTDGGLEPVQERSGELFSAGVPTGLRDPISHEYLLMDGIPPDGIEAPTGDERIGFIDSGVIAEHPQLRGLQIVSKDFTQTNVVDTVGHGTAMLLVYLASHATTSDLLESDAVRAALNVLPRFYVAKVTDRKRPLTRRSVIAAINWLHSQRVKIVNVSLGFRGSLEENSELCQAVASHPNMLFVAAAGNYGPDVEVFPAACPAGVLSVGVDSASSGTGVVNAPAGGALLPQSEMIVRHAIGVANRLRHESAHEEARLFLQRACAAYSKVPLCLTLAALEIDLGLLDEAEQHAQTVLRMEPGNVDAALLLAYVFALRQDWRLAEAQSRSVLTHAEAGSSPEVQANLLLAEIFEHQGAKSSAAPYRARLATLNQKNLVSRVFPVRPSTVTYDPELPKRPDAGARLHALIEGKLDAPAIALLADNYKLLREPNDRGLLPIHVAVARGCHTLLSFLLHRYPGQAHVRGPMNLAPLHVAAVASDAEAIRLLAGYDAYVDPLDSEGWTPLHHAIFNSKAEAAAQLLDLKANVNAVNKGGSTAIHLAARQGSLQLVQLLVENGADLEVRNGEGMTALDLAVGAKAENLANWLQERVAKH